MEKTWGEALQEELQQDPDFLTEMLVLRVNGAIRRRMRELGITQSDLAARLGVSQPYVSKLLNYNANLTLRSLARIAWALDAEWSEPVLCPQTMNREYDAVTSEEVDCEVSLEGTSVVSPERYDFVPFESEPEDEVYTADGFPLAFAA